MHVASTHLSDFTDVVAGHFRSHDVTGPDRISGELVSCSYGSVGLTRLSYGSRIDIKAAPLGSFTLLQIPIRGEASEPDGPDRRRFGLERGQILSPSRMIDFAMHRNCRLLITRFENEDIKSMLTDLGDSDETEAWMKAMKQCDLTSPAGRALVSQLIWLDLELSEKGSVLQRMERHFSNNLLASFLVAAVPELSRTSTSLPTISVVRRVEAYMDANLHEPITVADLAKVAGVPVRSLYDLFSRYKMETPAELLRKKRLHAAKDMFHNADRDELTVTDVAMSCGFVHIGRFSSYYRAEHGEAPSTTLARRRRTVAIRFPHGVPRTFN